MNKFENGCLVGKLVRQTLIDSFYFILIVSDLQVFSLKADSLTVK